MVKNLISFGKFTEYNYNLTLNNTAINDPGPVLIIQYFTFT